MNMRFLLLACLTVSLVTGPALAQPAPAELNVRVFWEGGPTFPVPCNQIAVTLTFAGVAPPKTMMATGTGASGSCTTRFLNLPIDWNMSLTAKVMHDSYSSLLSKAHPGYPPSSGQWTNPFKLASGANPSKYVMIYGKP